MARHRANDQCVAFFFDPAELTHSGQVNQAAWLGQALFERSDQGLPTCQGLASCSNFGHCVRQCGGAFVCECVHVVIPQALAC